MGVGTRGGWTRSVGFVLAESLFVVIAAVVMRTVVPWLGGPVLLYGPGIALVLVLPAFRPRTRAGAAARSTLLGLLAASVVVTVVLAAHAADDMRMYGVGEVFGGGLWGAGVSGVVGAACAVLLAVAAARGERTAFLCAAGASLGAATWLFTTILLDVLLGTGPES